MKVVQAPRGPLPRWAVFLAWLLLLSAMLEIFTRTLVLKLPARHDVPGLGVVPVDSSTTVWGIEGYGVTRYLADGEISTPYRSGVSVVVLGDSLTEAWQVHDAAKYVSVAEDVLRRRGLELDLHNLGASGRNIADYVYMAPFIMRTYAPAVVVVQVTESDFLEAYDASRPSYFVRGPEALMFEHNAAYTVPALELQNLVRATGIGSLAINKLTPVAREYWERLERDLRPQTAPEEPAGRDLEAPVPREAPLSGAAEGAMAREIELQAAMLREAYAGADLVLLVIPSVPAVGDGRLIAESAQDESLVAALSEPDGLPVLYPRAEFVELYRRTHEFPRGFPNSLPNAGHLNLAGNRVLGLALADYLERQAR